jgi:propionate CoA-transferase
MLVLLIAAAVVVACAAALIVYRRVAEVMVGSPLTAGDIIAILLRMIRFGAGLHFYNVHQVPTARLPRHLAHAVARNPRFVTAAEAVSHIPDQAVVLSCGFAALEPCFILLHALRKRYVARKRLAHLDWISVNAHGTRGRAPGGIDELAAPGVLRRYIAGHVETARGLLRQGALGTLEIYNLPLGTLAELVQRQAGGDDAPLGSAVGVGTSMDPRCGDTSRITPRSTATFVEVARGGATLLYSIPPITVCLLNAVCADTDGNVYLHRNVVLTESIDGARAAKRHGGIVIASVQEVIARDDTIPRELVLSADLVDFVCVCTATRVSDPLDMRSAYLPSSAPDVTQAYYRMRFAAAAVGFTPRRSAPDVVLGRATAMVFADVLRTTTAVPFQGQTLATLGVGLPEEVAFNLFTHRVTPDRVTLCCESGTIGGIPGSGVFFGGAIKPYKIVSEATIFSILEKHLHITCLGALEVDVQGNVNVSRRAAGVEGAVGTGGFTNFITTAKNIVFVFGWMTGGHIAVHGPRVCVQRRGCCKIVHHVTETTFAADRALLRGQRVWYCTHVGIFELLQGGVTLTHVFPGVSVDRDVTAVMPCGIQISPTIKVLPDCVVTGLGYTIYLPAPLPFADGTRRVGLHHVVGVV